MSSSLTTGVSKPVPLLFLIVIVKPSGWPATTAAVSGTFVTVTFDGGRTLYSTSVLNGDGAITWQPVPGGAGGEPAAVQL